MAKYSERPKWLTRLMRKTLEKVGNTEKASLLLQKVPLLGQAFKQLNKK